MEEKKMAEGVSKEEFLASVDEIKNDIVKSRNRSVTDAEMGSAVGGIGGKGECTCPKCGKPMKKVQFGDMKEPFWKCDECDINQMLDDAETIEMYKALERKFGPTYVEKTYGYPMWYKYVKPFHADV